MLYSEPLIMDKERPGLHTCALWEIGPQLALVESFIYQDLNQAHKLLCETVS